MPSDDSRSLTNISGKLQSNVRSSASILPSEEYAGLEVAVVGLVGKQAPGTRALIFDLDRRGV
jgi:hypothetical protein